MAAGIVSGTTGAPRALVADDAPGSGELLSLARPQAMVCASPLVAGLFALASFRVRTVLPLSVGGWTTAMLGHARWPSVTAASFACFDVPRVPGLPDGVLSQSSRTPCNGALKRYSGCYLKY